MTRVYFANPVREGIKYRNRLKKLGEFAMRLATDTNQESVFIAINNARHYIGQ